VLQKFKAIDQEIFNLEPCLIKLHFSNWKLLALSVSWRLLLLNKVWHKVSVRNYFEPCEGKARIPIRTQILKQISHVKLDLPLCFLIKAIRCIKHGQNVNQHTIVRLLIKSVAKLAVVRIELCLNEFKDFRHELLLVEFKCLKQHNH